MPDPVTAKGSQRRMRDWVESAPEALEQAMRDALDFGDGCEARFDWRSPIASRGYAEIRDDLWREVGLTTPTAQEAGFWPRRGPVWDAVARVPCTDGPGVVMVEAKSHAAELRSGPTKASPASRAVIARALDETKEYLGVPASVSWLDRYYQVANRLAYLYFLRVRSGAPAWLCSIYFVGDAFASGTRTVTGPESEAGWQAELAECKRALGLPAEHALSAYTCELFLPAVPVTAS